MKQNLIGKLVALLFVVLVVPFAVYGFWRQYQNNTVVLDRMRASLFEPYAAVLRAGEHADAYQRFTSARYKARYSEGAFHAAQAKNAAEYGAFARLKISREIAEETIEPGRGRYYRVSLNYEGAQRGVVVVFEVVEEAGAYLIDATYANPYASGPLQSRVY